MAETQAGRIRRFALERCVEPARQTGQASIGIRVGDIARDMNLQNRIPAVCSALGGTRFARMAGVRLLERRGPVRSTTTEFYYEILDRPDSAGAMADAGRDRRPNPVFTAGTPPDDEGGNTLYLVSCVKKKRTSAALAKDLYISDWFCKARACVERMGHPWLILSAKYGLVDPERTIEPYDKTLKAMPVAERRAWAQSVLAELGPALAGVDTVVFFAGMDYRKYLEPVLRQQGFRVRVPMEGLSQGRQLSWLGVCLDD